jgi:hypothetical protein
VIAPVVVPELLAGIVPPQAPVPLLAVQDVAASLLQDNEAA